MSVSFPCEEHLTDGRRFYAATHAIDKFRAGPSWARLLRRRRVLFVLERLE